MLTKTQKIATLLMSFDSEQSAEVLKYLDPEQVALITQEIAGVSALPHQVQRAVLREFRSRVQADASPDASPLADPNGTPYLATLLPARAAELLVSEPPPIIARLLVHVPPAQSAAILECLPAATRGPIMQRLANTPPLTPELRVQLETALRAKALRQATEEGRQGREALTRLQLETPDPAEPAADFTFYDLPTLDPAILREVVTACSEMTLICALRGADAALAETLLAVFPFRHRVQLRHRLQCLGPVTLGEITRAQAQLMQLAQAQRRTTPIPETVYA